jgi:cell division protein FtsW
MLGIVFIMMIIGRVPMKHISYIISFCVIVAIVGITLVLTIGKSKSQLADGDESKQVTEVVVADNDKAAESAEEEAKKKERGGILHRFDLWKQRIDDFMDNSYVAPEDYDLDKKGQVGHANIAIASSHIIGIGPGNSVQRDFLPLAFSDFIYAIIFEEMGLFGAAFVTLLYISLLFRTGYIARRCVNPFPAFLAMGLALLIVVQALFNMMVATGLAPVTGQPLPLISKGGTSSVINCIYIGMILSISRTAKKVEEQNTNKNYEEH